MGWFVSDERVPVELAECRCPETPHDHDTVWLRAELGLEGGYAALRAIRVAAVDSEALAEELGRTYARWGIVDWTFMDDDGPIECTPENIARLSWDVIYPIAERGDELYGAALLRPLLARASKSSQRGQTAASTSRKRRSTSTRRKPSKPSTTAITQLRPTA